MPFTKWQPSQARTAWPLPMRTMSGAVGSGAWRAALFGAGAAAAASAGGFGPTSSLGKAQSGIDCAASAAAGKKTVASKTEILKAVPRVLTVSSSEVGNVGGRQHWREVRLAAVLRADIFPDPRVERQIVERDRPRLPVG